MMRAPSSFNARVLLLLAAGVIACAGEPEPTDSSMTQAGDGDSGDTEGGGFVESTGEGDGDGEADTDCPLGSFDCPCDNGMCEPGLSCGPDGLCRLGGGDGDGDLTTSTTSTTGDTTTTGDGGPEGPYDPEACMGPAEVLVVEGMEGEFCAAPCTEDADCPDGPAGTTASCAISISGEDPEFCTLICMAGSDACPEGSSCEEIPQQPGWGLCTF